MALLWPLLCLARSQLKCFCASSKGRWIDQKTDPCGTICEKAFMERGFPPVGSAAVYALQFLDMLGFKSLARKGFAEQAKRVSPIRGIHRSQGTYSHTQEAGGKNTFPGGALEIRPSLRCGRLLIHILIKDRDYAGALDIAERLSEIEPDNPRTLLVGRGYPVLLFEGQRICFRVIESP